MLVAVLVLATESLLVLALKTEASITVAAVNFESGWKMCVAPP